MRKKDRKKKSKEKDNFSLIKDVVDNNIPDGKLLINTINAHSYNTALKDSLFA